MRTAHLLTICVLGLLAAACVATPTSSGEPSLAPSLEPVTPTVKAYPTSTTEPPTATSTPLTPTPTATETPTPIPSPTITPFLGPVETLVYAESTGAYDGPVFEYITWINSDGSGKKQVNYFFDPKTWTDFAFYVYNPNISSDGHYLAAVVQSVFSVLNLQTAESTDVIGGGNAWQPASWEPGGRRLIVSYGYQLAIWDTDTRQVQRVETSYVDLMPAWSPTDEYIAFTRYDKNAFDMIYSGVGQLCIMKPDGSGLRVLSEQAFFQGITLLDNYQSFGNVLSWSPNGQWIVFLSGDPPDIAIVNVQTGETRLLASDPAKDVNPSWSPDGERIAFASNRNGRDQIFSIKPDGSDLLLLTADLIDGNAYAPVWSPLGAHIAFLTWDQKTLPNGLYVMNADGSGKVFIQGGSQRPAWSPIPAP